LGAALVCGAAAGFAISTPLFQLNFLPDFTQVKVFPEATEVFPALGQEAPAFTAATAGIDKELPRNATETRRTRDFFMFERVLSLEEFVSSPYSIFVSALATSGGHFSPGAITGSKCHHSFL
jgi:hypothetical protein